MARRRVFPLPAFGVLTAVLVLAACAPKDRLAAVKRQYPGAGQYLAWMPSSPPKTEWLLVRYAPDPDGSQRALLLQHDRLGWQLMAESRSGFTNLREVVTCIPNIDESGVAAFGLK